MTAFQRTVASFQQGARTMPREYYTSPAILAEEWRDEYVHRFESYLRGKHAAILAGTYSSAWVDAALKQKDQ